jgi:uncharacterized protein
VSLRLLTGGAAEGAALVLDEPLSLWGGLDPATGRIVEVGHPQRGSVVSGRILVMPAARGSSSSATVLAETIRLGTAPAGILLGQPDEILATGALVAEELYGVRLPILVVGDALDPPVEDDEVVRIEATSSSRPPRISRPARDR